MLEPAIAPPPASVDRPDREFAYLDEDFDAVARILREEAGISLPAGKAPLVYARLVKRLRALGLASFAQYVTLLQSPGAAAERVQMVTALTTNVTRFFREPHHLDHLRTQAIGPLLDRARQGARIRLWSAACSNGQEPYSMAAMIADLLPKTARLDIKILATDINPAVLEHAKAGRYESIDGVPRNLRRWFHPDGPHWRIDDGLREMVTFRHLNLNAPWPMRGPFDVVFCRNVAIYFDPEVQARLWSSFAAVMRPDAFLYIGHSERVSGEAACLFDNVGITTYQRRSAAR